MKYVIAIAIISVFSQSTCNKISHDVPECVQQKIREIKSQPKWNPPAEVNEYTYQGRRVFLFTADCCDQYIQLFDDQCNYVCAPSGGFSGKGDNKCPDFNSSAVHKRLVWKDER